MASNHDSTTVRSTINAATPITREEIALLAGGDERFDGIVAAVAANGDVRSAAAQMEPWAQRAIVVRARKLLPDRAASITAALGLDKLETAAT